MLIRILKSFSRVTLAVAGSLLGGIILAYFLLTSSGFLTGAVLPVISYFAKVEIDADELYISPFKSRLSIKDFRIGPVERPWLAAESISLEYFAWQLLRQNVKLNNVKINGLKIRLSLDRHGYLELPHIPLLDPRQTKTPPVKKRTSAPSQLRFDITNLKITDSGFAFVAHPKLGSYSELRFDHLNLTLPRLKNDLLTKLSLTSNLQITSGESVQIQRGLAELDATFMIDAQNQFQQLALKFQIGQLAGTIEKLPVNHQRLTLQAKASKLNQDILYLQEFQLLQYEGDEVRSNISMSGGFSQAPLGGRLQLSINPLSQEMISIVSAFSLGIDPGNARLTYQGNIEFLKDRFRSQGDLQLNRRGAMRIGQEKLHFPDWTFHLKYAGTANLTQERFRLNQFELSCRDPQRPFLNFRLEQPLSYTWNEAKPGYAEATPEFNLQIDHLNPASFNPLLKPYQVSFGEGDFNLKLHGIMPSGQSSFDLDATTNAEALFIRLHEFDLELKKTDYIGAFTATLDPMTLMFKIKRVTLSQRDAGGSLGFAEGRGEWDLKTLVLNAHVEVSDFINRAVAPQPMIPDFVREILTDVMSRFHPTDFKFASDLTLDLWNGYLKLHTAQLRFTQPPVREEQKLNVQDFYINWGSKDFYMAPFTSTLELNRFAATQVNAWVPRPFCRTGLLSGKIVFYMADLAAKMYTDAQLAFQDLTLTTSAAQHEKLSIYPKFRLALTNYDWLTVKNLQMRLFQGQEQIATFQLAPCSGSISIPAKNPVLDFQLALTGAPFRELNGYLKNSQYRFLSGQLAGALHGVLQQFGRQTQLNGELRSSPLAIQDGPRRVNDLSVATNFDISLTDYNQLRLKPLILKFAISDSPLMNSRISGSLQLREGEGQLKAELPEFSETLVQLFQPNFPLQFRAAGEYQAELSEKYQKFIMSSDLQLSGISSGNQTPPMGGRLQLDLIRKKHLLQSRDCRLQIHQDQTPVADLRFQMKLDQEVKGQENIVQAELSSTRLDLLRLHQFFHHPVETRKPWLNWSVLTTPFGFVQHPEPVKLVPEPTFNCGPWQINTAINLKGLTYTPQNQLTVGGNLKLKGTQFDIPDLKADLNGSPIFLTASGNSTPTGIEFQLDGQFDQLSLAPLAAPFFEGNLRNLSGTVENTRLHLTGKGIMPPRFWDNLNGTLQCNFSDITLPNEFQQSLLGYIFFLPLNILNEVKLSALSGGFRDLEDNFFTRLVNRTENIELNSGVVKLTSSQGTITLNQFHFQGDVIQELSFTGSLRLGSQPDLTVSSLINIDHIMLPVTLRGTLANPQPAYALAALKFTAFNTGQLLKTATNLVSGGLLQQLINVFLPSSSKKSNSK